MTPSWDLTLVAGAGGGGTGGLPDPGPRWRFVACELDGTPIGDLGQAYDRKVRHAFNGRLKTCSFRLRLDNPIADALLAGAALVKAYEDQELRLVGELASFEEVASGDGGSLAFTFADALARLGWRLLGKDAVGYVDGTAASPIDKSTLASNLLAAANASGYTGIEAGDVTTTGSTGSVAFAPYKDALSALGEIVNAIDGPDIELLPVEPTTNGSGVQIGELTVQPAIGEAKPNAAFEYGYGRRNVASYKRRGDLTILLNRAYNLPPSSDTTATVMTATDATSITNYGLREGLVATDVEVAELRQDLVDEHVAIRKSPRVLIEFQPTREDPATPGRVPQYGQDFTLGDAVPFRAVSEAGVVRVDALLRVYAIDWAIDDNGTAAPTFTLTSE